MQCEAGLYGQCLLQIWSGTNSSGQLLASYSSTFFLTSISDKIFASKQIFVKFTADSPRVRFLANWWCAFSKLLNRLNLLVEATFK
jgi:hypothetical protein